jgi:hypothetical protein
MYRQWQWQREAVNKEQRSLELCQRKLAASLKPAAAATAPHSAPSFRSFNRETQTL